MKYFSFVSANDQPSNILYINIFHILNIYNLIFINIFNKYRDIFSMAQNVPI